MLRVFCLISICRKGPIAFLGNSYGRRLRKLMAVPILLNSFEVNVGGSSKRLLGSEDAIRSTGINLKTVDI